jgi:hypothetical protein
MKLKEVKGNGRCLIEVLFLNLPGQTEENYVNLGQDIRLSGRDSKLVLIKYCSKMLPICLVPSYF